MYRRRRRKRRLTTLGYVFILVVVALFAGCGCLTYTLLSGGGNEKQVASSAVAPKAVATAPKGDVAAGSGAEAKGGQNSPPAPQAVEEGKADKVGVDSDAPYTILIKKSEFKLYVKKGEQIVETFGCALGKNKGDKTKRNDMKTPVGTFVVDEICDAHSWSHDFNDGKGVIEHAYGPWFFSLDTSEKSKGQWDGIGIHGTHDPGSIGTLASEGCIRLENENVEKLKQSYIKVGTKVTIEE